MTNSRLLVLVLVSEISKSSLVAQAAKPAQACNLPLCMAHSICLKHWDTSPWRGCACICAIIDGPKILGPSMAALRNLMPMPSRARTAAGCAGNR